MNKRSWVVHQLSLSPEERDQFESICAFALYKLDSCDYYYTRFTASQIIEKLYNQDFEDICVIPISEGCMKRFIKMIQDVATHPGAPSFAKTFEKNVLEVLK